MRFADTKLPRHPVIEKAFDELTRLDTGDQFTERGVHIARIIAADSLTKDPEAIAAGLLVPLTSDAGPVLLAQAEIPPRVTEIVQAVFAVGGLAMSSEPVEEFYTALDSGARAVILASSFRMFEVMAAEMEESLAVSRKSGAAADADYLRQTLDPVKKFSAMICKAETVERPLAEKCDDAVAKIEALINGANNPQKPSAQVRPPSP